MSQRQAAAEPAPRRIVSLDLDSEAPDLTAASGGSETVMLVGCRGGVPVGAVDLELTSDPAEGRRGLDRLRGLPVAEPLPVVPDGRLPSITVVVPTIVGRDDELRLLCAGLLAVDYPDAEFLLVDNRVAVPSGDILPSIAADHPGIRIVTERVPGISAARNAGIAAARGEVVVFTDDDVQVDPGWLRAIGTRFASDPAIDVVTGLILPAELDTPAQIWFEQYYGGFAGERSFSPKLIEAVPGLPRPLRAARLVARDDAGAEITRFALYGVGAFGAGANMGFRRTALDREGGFDPALGTGTPTRGGEDLAMLISIIWTGGRLAFEPRAVVHHRHRRTLPELERQLFGYGLGFTACMTSLVLADPRHLLAVAWQLPPAIRSLTTDKVLRLVTRPRRGPGSLSADALGAADAVDPEATRSPRLEADSYPLSLARHELRGYPRGPLAYLRSRRRHRRLSR
ncbi:glycosyltransferase family 2 protein [Frondihabitans peucedani]|uniref:Glycosyltransferase 2-like domain-containing protein n=1 Tax=Frondihabitans peucedani TaxID=598626 RepID=A0ABP8E1Y0_9MICO